jgi:hypothetical protein
MGAAMQKADFNDLTEMPERVDPCAAVAASNAAHLANALQNSPDPGVES